MKNKQTTFQFSYASAASGGFGVLGLGGLAAGIKSLCSGKSKDAKETEQGEQSTQPAQELHYAAVPLETIVPIEEEVESHNHREERRRLNG